MVSGRSASISCSAVKESFSANSLLIPFSSLESAARNIKMLTGMFNALHILLMVERLGSLFPCSNSERYDTDISASSDNFVLVMPFCVRHIFNALLIFIMFTPKGCDPL